MRALLIFFAACSTLDIAPEANIADGDTGVAPVAVFQLPLDPDTPTAAVDDSAVSLTDDRGFPLPVTAAFDADIALLEITPIRPMTEGTTYTLESATLRDVNGEAISLSFATLDNPLFRQFNYVPGTVDPTDYTETDDQGRDLRFTAPGPDRVWPSPDDVLGSYTVPQDRSGDTQLTITFSLGPDGVPFNGDDLPTQYRKSVFEGESRIRNDQYLAGPDGVVESADDTLQQVREEVRNEAGQLTALIIGLDGGDNIPGSPDDNIFFGLAVIYDERGLLERTESIDPGPDGMFLTPDDIIPDGPPLNIYDDRGVYLGSLSDSNRSTNYVDNRGISYREDFFDAGADNTIETPDDRINFRVEYRVP